MAWTSVGFDGTITEIQWAGLAGLLGNGYVAAGNGDCLVTAVSGARSVSVAAGSLYGDGVLSTNSGAETVALTTPTNGQWYVIALRRTWASNTAALVAIAGATTTTTTPTAPPTSFPTLNTNVGVLTDQPIAWAWCNSANTTVVVYDIRLKAVKSLPPVVATSAERDAKFMSPTQGLQVWRDDLGAVETYYGLYNVSTNPGGRDTAGWYVDTRQTGLRPIKPTSATIVTGTGSANSLGVVSFSGSTATYLNGIFTSEYSNYRVVVQLSSTSTASDIALQFTVGGTPTGSGYQYAKSSMQATTWGCDYQSTSGTINCGRSGGTGGVSIIADIVSPQKTENTKFLGQWVQGASLWFGNTWGNHTGSTSFDGLVIYGISANITGTIQILGYND